MIEVPLAREVASPAPPHSRHSETPTWWPEWIAQVLAAPLPAHPAPAAVMARAAVPTPEGTDDWAATVAGHQVHLARRAVRALLDAVAATGPGSRLEWCLCGESAAAG